MTFIDLQMSDSKKYYCGLDKFWFDKYIKVNLMVDDAPVPSTVPPVAVSSASVSPCDPSGAATSSPLNIPTETSGTQGLRIIPYLAVGFVFAIATLMLLLKLMRTMMRRKETDLRRIDSPQEFSQANAEYSQTRREDQPTERQSEAHFSSGDSNTDDNSLYANSSYLLRTELAADCKNKRTSAISSCAFKVTRKDACTQRSATNLLNDSIYSVAELHTEQPQTTQTGGSENDCLYTLAQLPRAT